MNIFTPVVVMASALLLPAAVNSAEQLENYGVDQHTMEATSTSFQVGNLDAIGEYFVPLVTSGHYRGATTLVAHNGEIIHFESYGKRGTEDTVTTGDDTIYWIGSMTKPVTGVAMMMLWEEGKFKLDDPVSKFLPEFKHQEVFARTTNSGSIITQPPARQMTIRDLMTHSAGLTYPWGDHPVNKAYREAGLRESEDLADLTGKLAKIPLMFDPGEHFHYSMSVDLQGRLVEVLSGMTLREFLKHRLFEPLGMVDTDFWVPTDKLDRLSAIYFRGDNGTLVEAKERAPWRVDVRPNYEAGGHGLASTVKDYWRFAQMLANGGSFQGNQYLKSTTIDLMSENHLPENSPWQIWNSTPIEGLGMGLNFGVEVESTDENSYVQRGEIKWNGSASTIFWVDRKNAIVAIAMTNIEPYEGQPIIDVLHRAIYGPG